MSSDRNLEIANLYVNQSNLSMDKIGKMYSISRERVRQIVAKVYPGYSRLHKPKLTLEEKEQLRIAKRIDKFWRSYNLDSATGCWNWNLGKFPSGYGCFHYGSEQYAHRVAWILTNGETGDLHVLHRCDNPSCINPSHMYLGTHRDNMMDREARFRGIPFSKRDKNTTPRRLPEAQ